MNFKPGDIAYLVENDRYINEGKITSLRDEMADFSYLTLHGSTSIRKSCLFASEEAAMARIRRSAAAETLAVTA